MDDSSEIISFTNYIWEKCFSRHVKAPITLYYDPMSTQLGIIRGSISGLCSIAHNSIYMNHSQYFPYDNDIYNPDSHIYAIDPDYIKRYGYSEQVFATLEIEKLPILECIIIVSCDIIENVNQLLQKATLNTIIITVNECIKLSDEWMELNIDEEDLKQEVFSYYDDSEN
jgi:hypothetical protein